MWSVRGKNASKKPSTLQATVPASSRRRIGSSSPREDSERVAAGPAEAEVDGRFGWSLLASLLVLKGVSSNEVGRRAEIDARGGVASGSGGGDISPVNGDVTGRTIAQFRLSDAMVLSALRVDGCSAMLLLRVANRVGVEVATGTRHTREVLPAKRG
jgi:hypothetical protein